MVSNNWDAKFMGLARHVATWSKDRSTKVGCVIVDNRQRVVSLGYNGFPRGVDDDDDSRHTRPAKYAWTEHAERNAIYNTLTDLYGTTLYIHWYPCMDCARAIVQSGIARMVAVEPDWNDKRWGESFDNTRELFNEVGLDVEFVS